VHAKGIPQHVQRLQRWYVLAFFQPIHKALPEPRLRFQVFESHRTLTRLWNKQSGVHVEAGTERASVDGTLLAEIPLLADASEAARAELATWFATERFDDGREIFQQGDAGDRLYIIAHGTVEVIREDTKQQLAKLSDGDYFGEMALLSEEPRNATVRAMGPCVCLSLQRDQFLKLLMREPVLREKMERVAAERTATRE